MSHPEIFEFQDVIKIKKLKQHFSHNSKNFPTFIFFTGKIIIKENRLVDFSKLNEVVCWLCIHAVLA